MLGKNAIRWSGLDPARLAEIDRRISPTIVDINATPPDIGPELMDNFQARGGYLKPWEGDERIPVIEPLVEEDISIAASA